MKKLYLLFIWNLLAVASMAQQTLTGKVYDAATNSPLQGAAIRFAGKGGVVTDKDGMFSINCSQVSAITVSFVGYETHRQTIKNCTDMLSIGLKPVTSSLYDVEITATSNLNKSILYQPVSITKLSNTELKRGFGLFLDDAINGNVPGVTMNRRAVSSGQQFNIRGYGNGSRGTRGVSSNFDGQGYKVYLNGIPVTDAEGITVLDDLDFGSISNVEVVKGPAGTLYGLAIAGVVNLQTSEPEPGKTSISQDVLVGNYGLQRYTTRFQTATDKAAIMVNYGHQKSDGFTIHNKSTKNFVNFVGNFKPNEKQTINSYFGYSNSYDERSGELTIAQYNNNDYSGNIEYIKRNAHSQVYSVRAGFGHNYMFNKNLSNSTTIFGTAFNSNASSAGGWTDKSSTNFGIRSSFNTKFTLGQGITLSGVTGVEAQRQNAQTIGYGMVKDPNDPNTTWTYGNPYYWIIGAITSDVYTTTRTTSLFTDWSLALPHDFQVVAGLGYSDMKIKLEDRFYNAATPNKTRQYDTTYKRLWSPHVAINKVFSRQFSAYASYSRAYKAPVSSYFYIPYAVGQQEAGVVNRNLKPETGDQYEIGAKGVLMNNRLIYELALFDAIFSDKMTTVAVPYNSTTTLFSYVTNGGKQNNKGIEALVKFKMIESDKGFFRTVMPFANITYSDFKYKDYKFQSFAGTTVTTLDYSGQPVAGVAKVLANAGIDLAMIYGFYGNVNYMYRDAMPITSDGVNKTTSYNLVNAKIGFKHSFGRHFDLDVYAGGNNLSNTKYPIMIFVNQIPDAYIAAPRYANFYGGLNVKYNF